MSKQIDKKAKVLLATRQYAALRSAGYSASDLKSEYGWGAAAGYIHMKAHPDIPCQNFSAIPQDLAMAYIEAMAEIEEGKATAEDYGFVKA
jgi:hypothetical protein